MSNYISPKELRQLIIEGDRSEETASSLPNEARILWLMRPNFQEIQKAKLGMFIRSALIALGFIYYFFFTHFFDSWKIFSVIAVYEIAYYTLRMQKCQNDYQQAWINHINKVDMYINSYAGK